MDNEDFYKSGFFDLLIERKTLTSVIYTFVSIPVYTICLIFIYSLFLLGIILSPLWIGIHILNATFKFLWYLSKQEEEIHEKYLKISLAKVSLYKPEEIGLKQLIAYIKHKKTWKRFIYFGLKPFIALLYGLPLFLFLGIIVTMVYAPISSVFGKIRFYSWYETDSFIEVVFIYFVSFITAVSLLHAMRYMIKLSSKITRSFLSR